MAIEFHLLVQQVLEAAVRVPPEERAAFVEQACQQNAALLREVRSLLPHYERTYNYEPGQGPDWFLPGTTTIRKVEAEAAAEMAEGDPEPPFYINEYRCDAVLGRGGMGIVYLAQHTSLRKLFALKLLRREILSTENRWRFALEAELLRRLRHPGIARIVEAREVRTARGTRPYLVMEYIRGLSLMGYADAKGLGVPQRLELLARVCEPIDYAHHRGIIHRDLKPGNILVDDGGRPRILDFGVARIQEFAPSSSAESPGGFIGTFTYASPEQKDGRNEALTPASDVYSLGLITHELLTGRRPQTVDGKLRLDLNRIHLDDASGGSPARQDDFRYLLHIIFSATLAESPAKRYRSAGRLGAAINAVLAEFAKPARWGALRSRLARLLAPDAPSSTEPTRRPLSAVLRKRIEMSMEAGRAGGSEDQSAKQTPPEDGDEDVYRLRDPDL
jgi:serine/threonine protein kinase